MSTHNELSLKLNLQNRMTSLETLAVWSKTMVLFQGFENVLSRPWTQRSPLLPWNTDQLSHSWESAPLSLSIPLSFSLWGITALAAGQCDPLFPISTVTSADGPGGSSTGKMSKSPVVAWESMWYVSFEESSARNIIINLNALRVSNRCLCLSGRTAGLSWG